MNNTIITIENLSKSFTSAVEEVRIFTDLSIHIEAQQKICVTGVSGCGKSTFLNLLAGLDAPDSGQIQVGEYPVHALDETGLSEYRTQYLGLIFQFHFLLKDFSALENIMLPALIAGKPRAEAQAQAQALLADVRLENRAHHFPYKLSGGERQRVAVARSLINDPQIILADEPTGNLDPANARLVEQLLFSLVDKRKKTLILVTHDQSIAASCDLIYNLENGSLQQV